MKEFKLPCGIQTHSGDGRMIQSQSKPNHLATKFALVRSQKYRVRTLDNVIVNHAPYSEDIHFVFFSN